MKNKAILLVGIFALGLIYYFTIFKTTEEKMESLDRSISSIRNEIENENSSLTRIYDMAEEVEEGKKSGSMIYDYDNSTAELSYLSSTFKYATDYNINFDDATTNDGQYVRRGVSVSFTASNYLVAKEIISDITNCPYRTIFKNVVIVPVAEADTKNPSLSKGSSVSVQADLIFIELCNGDVTGLKQEGGNNNE